MRMLFYSSLVLPAIYVATVLSFFLGLPFGFDLAEFIRPHNGKVISAILGLTFGFVAICLVILWAGKTPTRTKVSWSLLLFLGNMIAVPCFLWCVIHGTVERVVDFRQKTV
jgi:hypothetical protein